MDSTELWDDRRILALPGDLTASVAFAAKRIVASGRQALKERGRFLLALSGGSTPKAVYQEIATTQRDALDWTKVHLFWSDERAVSSTDAESNYKMAMEAGLCDLAIPEEQIHRMPAEQDLQEAALEYDSLIKKHGRLDTILLGVGEDGHTASLFPNTHALDIRDRFVVANHVPQKNGWRMTMTFACINDAREVAVYAFGRAKAEIVRKIFAKDASFAFPAERIGTPLRPALWVLDREAAVHLSSPTQSATK